MGKLFLLSLLVTIACGVKFDDNADPAAIGEVLNLIDNLEATARDLKTAAIDNHSDKENTYNDLKAQYDQAVVDYDHAAGALIDAQSALDAAKESEAATKAQRDQLEGTQSLAQTALDEARVQRDTEVARLEGEKEKLEAVVALLEGLLP